MPVPALRGLALDLVATARGLTHRPIYALTAITTLAVGIGASTTMFGAVDAILVRDLPYAEPDRLVALLPGTFINNRDVDQFRRRSRTLDRVAAFSPGWLMTLTEVDVPRQLNAARISGTLLPMVGARPLLGRTLGIDDEQPGRARVAVLGHRTWRESFEPVGLDGDLLRAFWRDGLARIDAIPGVERVATVLHLPMSGRSWNADITVDGRPLPAGVSPPRSAWQAISADYFATTGIPLVDGRAFTAADAADAPRVAVVNTSFAAALFPGESPLGKRVTAGNATRRELATIVGVVGGVRHDSLSAAPIPEVYVPFDQRLVYATSLVIRASGDPVQLAGAVRERLWSVNPNVAITNMRSMDDVFAGSLQRHRMILALLVGFAVAGIALGGIGVYGVVAYGVQQRMRELGIRAALGATPGSLSRLVVRSGLRSGVIGIAIGVPVALAAGGALRGMVYGVASNDPVSLALGSALLLMVATLASWLPARRALRHDPMRSLRRQ